MLASVSHLSLPEFGDFTCFGEFRDMDGPSNIGRRVVKRAFESNRHSAAMLAKAFEWLTDASNRLVADCHSVQDRRENGGERRLMQEVNQ